MGEVRVKVRLSNFEHRSSYESKSDQGQRSRFPEGNGSSKARRQINTMKRRISKAEAQAFKERWEAANAAEREELRTTPIAQKLRQLNALMASVGKLGWTEALAAEEAEVRGRWSRLRGTRPV